MGLHLFSPEAGNDTVEEAAWNNLISEDKATRSHCHKQVSRSIWSLFHQASGCQIRISETLLTKGCILLILCFVQVTTVGGF
jgi:hypothetical protein